MSRVKTQQTVEEMDFMKIIDEQTFQVIVVGSRTNSGIESVRSLPVACVVIRMSGKVTVVQVVTSNS